MGRNLKSAVKEILIATVFTLVMVALVFQVAFDPIGNLTAKAAEATEITTEIPETATEAAVRPTEPFYVLVERISGGVGKAAGLAAQKATEISERKAREEAEAKRRYAIAPTGVPQWVWDLATTYETKSVSAYVLCGVAKVESDFNRNCVTGVCYGLMQLHSAYEFKYLNGEHWSNARANMRAAAKILNEHYKRYNSIHKTLMVYNEGWGGNRSGTSPYSRKVMKWAEEYKRRHK